MTEKKENIETIKTNEDMLNEQMATLPLLCEKYIRESGTERAVSTRLAYARELNTFFDFLVSDSCMPQYDEDNNVSFSFHGMDKRSLTGNDIRMIKSSEISQYLTYRKTYGDSQKTLARKRAALSSYFSYMVDNRYLDYSPVAAASKVKISKSDDVIHINVEEQIQLLNDIDTGAKLDEKKQKYHEKYQLRDLTLVTLLLDTGMRISEVYNSNVGNVDFNESCIHVTRKGGKKQKIYFSDEASLLLSEYLRERIDAHEEVRDDSPLFTTKETKHMEPRRLSIRAMQELVKKYTRASLPGKGGLSPHKMRSSFAMAFYEASGKDILALQKKLGHNSLAATNVYAKATDSTMRDTRNLVSKKLKTGN